MKIGFITPEFPHPRTGYSGGIGTSIKNLSKGLVQLGHQVVIIIYGQQSDAFFVENGISFYLVKNIKIKGLSRILTQQKLKNLINKIQLDVLEAPDWTGITSSLQPNCKVVIRLNGSDTYFCFLDGRPVKFMNRYYEKRALQKADGYLSVSAYTAQVTNQLFKLNQKFTIIPNSIDLDSFKPDATPIQPFTILYFGTLIRKKGLLELPHIFNKVVEQIPEAKLVLIGRDNPDILTGNASTWEMMQIMFSDAALSRVNYLGGVAYDEMRFYIAQASVCVFPTFAEALPVSWIEAMALEKAIVASNIGWAPEVIENDKEGFLVSPKSHQTYAEAIIRLLQDTELNENFGKAARKKVQEKFSIDVVSKQSSLFYQKITQS